MKFARPAIVVGILAAVLLMMGLFGALLLPGIVDSRMIRERIEAALPKDSVESLMIGKIALVWFPRPSLVLENADVAFAEGAQGSIAALKLYPSILDLLLGRLIVRRVLLLAPALKVSLPDTPEGSLDLEELEKQIGAALLRLTQDFPISRIEISQGSAEIRIGARPPVRLHDVSAKLAAMAMTVRVELSARSNLWQRVTLDGAISPERLLAELDIRVERLKLNQSLAFLPRQVSQSLRQGDVSLDVEVVFLGLRQVKASIGGSADELVLAGPRGTAVIRLTRFDGAVTYQAGAFQVDMEKIELASPRLRASGQLKIEAGSSSARIKAQDVDIAEVSGLALQISDDEGIKQTFRYVSAGRIPEMTLQSTGRSLADMRSSENLIASGTLQHARIFIPGPDLEFKNVSAALHLVARQLKADNVSGNLGAMHGRDGALRLGLEGRNAPFHLELSVDSRAPELLSVLRKVFRDEALRTQLLKVRKVDGELSGRLILGETIDALSPVVAISNAAISAEYEPIQFPIAIRSGRLTYDQKRIRLEHAHGTVGRSRFAELGITLALDGSRRIKIDSKQASLDLQEAETLLRNLKQLRLPLEKLASARGRVDFENSTLDGAYDDPGRWKFASTGTFDQVEIQHLDLPGAIGVSRANFDVNERRILLSDAAATMSDAALSGAAMLEYANGEPVRLEMSGLGTVGEQMTRQLSPSIQLPKDVRLRSALKINTERFTWTARGEISVLGQIDLAGGPVVRVDAATRPQELAIKNLTVDDNNRHARMTVQFAQGNLDVSFDGELTQQTIDKVFTSLPMKVGSLRGGLKVSAALVDPVEILATGQLSGSDVSVPLGTDNVLLDKFTVEASGQSAQIRSADLRLGKSRLRVEGTVGLGKEPSPLDLDVAADRLSLEEVDRLFGGGDEQRNETARGFSFPRAQGTIRVKADSFTIDRFTFSPLQVRTGISSSSIRAEIERSVVCGINTTGRFELAETEMKLDVQLVATKGQLEPTTICLTQQQHDVTGAYSLKARVTGRGNRDREWSAFNGEFHLTAQNGEFLRSPGMDATFDYLNRTGDFKVAFPDLDREKFPYQSINLKGRIEDKLIVAEEVNVTSTLLNLSGQGTLDLERKQINGKGLIAVLKPVDEVIGRIPVLKSVVSGSFVGIPVRVTGSTERPEVSYLSPADVGAELLNIPVRILGRPIEAIKLFTPAGDKAPPTEGQAR